LHWYDFFFFFSLQLFHPNGLTFIIIYFASADINECTLGTDTCNTTVSTCQNTPGSYNCQCLSGTSGTGCSGMVFSFFFFFFFLRCLFRLSLKCMHNLCCSSKLLCEFDVEQLQLECGMHFCFPGIHLCLQCWILWQRSQLHW